ncbi:sigma-70 family RNA polymerase sigma factor [bacterium]|nr:sigma-70 family RNA polymerase sigma factor [bacterium]
MSAYDTRHTLLHRARDRGDEAAWAEFTGYYRDFIYMVVHKMGIKHPDSDDLVQTSFLKVWKNIDRFKVDDDRAKFRTWLSTMIRNLVINHINQRKGIFDKLQSMEDNRNVMPEFLHTVTETEVEEVIQKEWETYVVNLAMKNIKTLFSARAIEIFFQLLDGADTKTIAERYEIEENSVHKLKNRVKNRLIEEIQRIRENLE